MQPTRCHALVDRIVPESGGAKLRASDLPVLEPRRSDDRFFANPSIAAYTADIDVFG